MESAGTIRIHVPECRAQRAGGRLTTSGKTEEAKQAINAALDLLHRRWMMRVIWELRGDVATFRTLQERCGDISPTVLNSRLSELKESGLVHRTDEGYALTALGRDLLKAYEPLLAWAIKWRRAKRQS